VLDKGYHSNDVLVILKDVEVRGYCSEPDRERRDWSGKEEKPSSAYQNRRRILRERGKRLPRQPWNGWNEASRICMRPEACGEPTCGIIMTSSSNDCSFMPGRSTWAWSWEKQQDAERHADSREARTAPVSHADAHMVPD
jgi:hypothetical protein